MSTIVKGYHCWRCGTELTELRLPVSRRDECAVCRAEIHVCKQCAFYDGRLANACREERAEHVADREKANFCDYYKPRADAYQSADVRGQSKARSQAEALFGGAGDDTQTGSDDPSQAAKDELKRLFGETED